MYKVKDLSGVLNYEILVIAKNPEEAISLVSVEYQINKSQLSAEIYVG